MHRTLKISGLLVWAIALAGAGTVSGQLVVTSGNGEGGANGGWEQVQAQVPMEKATYLGIGAAPAGDAMASQLGLAKGSGLVVTLVDAKSPAAGKVEVNDVLLKVNDQLLFNQQQLSALVRTFKAGDEVNLSLLRAGKPVSVAVKLVEKEMPKFQPNAWNMPGPSGGNAGASTVFRPGAGAPGQPLNVKFGEGGEAGNKRPSAPVPPPPMPVPLQATPK